MWRLTLILLFLSNFTFGQNKIFDIISENEELSTLEELLRIAELDELLQGDDYFSIIAPDNNAFDSVFTAEELDTLKMNIDNVLIDLLHFHLIPNDTFDMNGSISSNTLYGKAISGFIDKSGNVIVVGSGSPYPYLGYNQDPILAENGRIYLASNGVLLPPTTPFFELMARNNFFYQAIIALNYFESFYDTDELYTGFLPPQDSILNSELYLSGALDDLDTLDAFLSKHVIPGYYKIEDLYDGLTLETLNGGSLNIYEIDDTLYVENARIIDQCRSTKGIVIYTDTYITERMISSTNTPSYTDLKIYPNPAQDRLFVASNNNLSHYFIELLDVNGHYIKSFKIDGHLNSIDISDIRSGYYLLKLTDAQGFSKTKKLVIH